MILENVRELRTAEEGTDIFEPYVRWKGVVFVLDVGGGDAKNKSVICAV